MSSRSTITISSSLKDRFDQLKREYEFAMEKNLSTDDFLRMLIDAYNNTTKKEIEKILQEKLRK